MQYTRGLRLVDKCVFHIKKVINRFFGKGPWKIQPFDQFIQNPNNPINSPENLTFKIRVRDSEVFYYPALSTNEGQFFCFDNHHFNITPKNNKHRYKESGLFLQPDQFLYSLENGAIFGSQGIIYNPSERVVVLETAKNYFIDSHYCAILAAPRIKLPMKRNGIALSFAHNGADGGFYHFFFESLGKTFLFPKHLIEKADYFVFCGPAANWKLKWLLYAGFEKEKIVWTEGNSNYQFDQLIFTSPAIVDSQPTKKITCDLKKLFRSEKTLPVQPELIIWTTRINDKTRSILWEEKIKEAFPNIYFIDFSQLTPKETIHFCERARFFIGPHGAGFCNLIFCPPQTKVIELFPSFEIQPIYLRLSISLGLEYTPIHCDFNNPASEFGFDFLVSILNKEFAP